jgi:hypothetical protein
MPKIINKHLTKDLLNSLDPDIIDAELTHGYIRIQTKHGETFNLDEQDLIVLLNFIRENK